MFGGTPALLLFTGVVQLCCAQTVFIPDINLRGWLNHAKPFSVDVNGFCDTTAWNTSPPNTVTCTTDTLDGGSTVDLEGLQYLKVASLKFHGLSTNTVSILWTGYPQANVGLEIDHIHVNSFSGALFPLANELNTFDCDSCGMQTLPAFFGTQLRMSHLDLGGGVLTVPPLVTWLQMDNCNLSDLPVMPSVTDLIVDHNPLPVLNNLPAGLHQISADYADLTGLPPLPAGLTSLSIEWNSITTLPALPSTLLSLDASINEIANVPALPADLWYLDLSYNNITTVPPLPASIEILGLTSCPITELPPLANLTQLHQLLARSTDISEVPPLPPSLTYLDVGFCSLVTCLPVLPQGMTTLRAPATGITCLPNMPPGLNVNLLGFSPVVCNVVNTPCPLAEPLITGTTFNDANVNGTFDGGDAPRPNSIVLAQPGDLLAGSDINGQYVLPADIGSFTLNGVPGLYQPVTTAPYAITFTALGQVDSLNHVGFTEIPGMYDLVTELSSSVVRPGFYAYVWVIVRNVGTTSSTAQVQLTIDAAQTYSSSSITPDQVNGNVVQWNVPALAPSTSWQTIVAVYTPNNVAPGTITVQQATATPDLPDQTPNDNTVVINEVVVSSYDPNDKRVEPTVLNTDEIAQGHRVEYTVRFQNTGTYMAERVIITDTLEAGLQLPTTQLIASSHACTWYIRHGVLHLLFNNINLPDSTSDEPGSHGFVRFSMVPSNALTIGSTVSNVANIYFDFNEPVITNTAVFQVEASTGMDELAASTPQAWPDPADEQLNLSAPQAMEALITVTDLTGRIVISERMHGTHTTLQVVALPTGMYQVHCHTVDRVFTTRFMKR